MGFPGILSIITYERIIETAEGAIPKFVFYLYLART